MNDPVRKPDSAYRGARRARGAAARGAALLAGAVVAAALAPPGAPVVAPPPARAQHHIATADTAHPLVRYADSTVSVNDRCIVRQTKLGPRVFPVYVNGLPIGFC
jgi:hypothetical protein